MLGRSILALALFSRALALPQTITPTTDALTTSNDNGQTYVPASALLQLCAQLATMGMTNPACDGAQQFSAADLCRSATTGSQTGSHGVGSLLKLALGHATGKLNNGDDDNNTSSSSAQPGVAPLLKLALGQATSKADGLNGKLPAGNGDASDEQPAQPTATGIHRLALVKAVKAKLDEECDDSESTASSSHSLTLAASLTASASAKATQTLGARDFVASRLASLAVTATRAATSSESASPTGFSRGGSDYRALSVDELVDSFASSSSSPTQTDDALVRRGVLAATRVASLALSATHASTTSEAASPTDGYTGLESDSDSFSLESLMDSARTEDEDDTDMPYYV